MNQDATVQLRRYKPDDLDAIVRLDALCFTPPFRFNKAAMRRFVEAENAWVLVADAEGEIVGFCVVHLEEVPGDIVGYLVTIDVAEGFRRTGLGKRLLSEGEEWALTAGGTGMVLHVYVKNDAALRFYQRAGYERAGDKPGFYGPGIDAAMYWKRFPST